MISKRNTMMLLSLMIVLPLSGADAGEIEKEKQSMSACAMGDEGIEGDINAFIRILMSTRQVGAVTKIVGSNKEAKVGSGDFGGRNRAFAHGLQKGFQSKK